MKRNTRTHRTSRKRQAKQQRRKLRLRKAQVFKTAIQVETPISMVFGGSPNCKCPICAENACAGVPQRVMDEHGNTTEVLSEKPEMMTVLVIPHARLSMYVQQDLLEMRIPVGCSLGDLLEYLRFKHPPLMRNFPPNSLRGVVNEQKATLDTILEDGQVIRADGEPDSQWNGFLSQQPSIVAQA